MNIEESPFQFLDNTPKIRVIIRKRPLGKKELQKNDVDILEVKGPQTVAVRETKYISPVSSIFHSSSLGKKLTLPSTSKSTFSILTEFLTRLPPINK